MSGLVDPSRPFLVIGEGDADIAFFKTLAELHNLGNLQFQFPKKGEGIRAGGIDGYGDLLKAIFADKSISALRGIAISADSDKNPQTAFKKVIQQIRQAGRDGASYGIPQNFLLPTPSSPPTPPILVVSLPWIDQPGSLETLIEGAFKNQYPEIWKCAETYFQCVEENHQRLDPEGKKWSDWLPQKKSKARLSALIAGICSNDPATSITYLWNRDNKLTHLREDLAFSKLVEFFRNIESYFAPPA